MVRPEAVRPRLAVLQNALSDLRRYRDRFAREQFLADRDAQNMVLFAMYLAAQAAIDLATHAVADAEGTAPPTYQDAFREAARIELLPAELAGRLTGWAGLRNVVAHQYPVIDYAKVHRALMHDLGDLEAFAAAAAGWLAS
jgi:uncharacterized protein YutE (UPF0331/DUF86 family)